MAGLQQQIFPATHSTTDMTVLPELAGIRAEGLWWWLTCEIMWLFMGGCCWGVGGRAGSGCGCGCGGCCWAVQGRRPRTDWDEVTWLHTSGAPSAKPKAKRRPTKSCKHHCEHATLGHVGLYSFPAVSLHCPSVHSPTVLGRSMSEHRYISATLLMEVLILAGFCSPGTVNAMPANTWFWKWTKREADKVPPLKYPAPVQHD